MPPFQVYGRVGHQLKQIKIINLFKHKFEKSEEKLPSSSEMNALASILIFKTPRKKKITILLIDTIFTRNIGFNFRTMFIFSPFIENFIFIRFLFKPMGIKANKSKNRI